MFTQKPVHDFFFITTSFILTPNWEQPMCDSIGEWISKLVYALGDTQQSNKE